MALDDDELPVRVQAALALTKMAEIYDSGEYNHHKLVCCITNNAHSSGCDRPSGWKSYTRYDFDVIECFHNNIMNTDLLKLSDETDLDILNNAMETMVERFQDELLPVATELTARLVCALSRVVNVKFMRVSVRVLPPPCT